MINHERNNLIGQMLQGTPARVHKAVKPPSTADQL